MDDMNSHYSSYANLPADRDFERIRDDLRALPAPGADLPAGDTVGFRAWLGRHLHRSSGMSIGHLHRA